MILAGSGPLTEAWGQNGFTDISPSPTEGCVDCLQTRADEILDCAYETDPLCQTKSPKFCSLEQLCKTRKSPSLAIHHDFGNGDILVNSTIHVATLEIRKCLLLRQPPKSPPQETMLPTTLAQDLLAVAGCVEKFGDKAKQEIGNFALCRDGVPLKDPAGTNPTKSSDASLDPQMSKAYECLETHIKLCKSEYLKYLKSLELSHAVPNNYSPAPNQDEESARMLGLSLTGSLGDYTPLVRDEVTEILRRTAIAKSAFENAKNDSISYLESLKLRHPKESTKYALMIERIQLLSLRFIPTTEINAHYDRDNHQLTIDSPALLFPSDAIYGIFLHEIGHATSACFTRKPLYQNTVHFSSSRPRKSDLFDTLQAESEADRYTFHLNNSDTAPPQVVSRALSFKDHPFRALKGCLSKRRAAKIHVKDAERRVRQLVEHSEEKNPEGTITEIRDSKKIFKELTEEMAACKDVIDAQYSEAEESGADWFEATVLEHNLKVKEKKKLITGALGLYYAYCPTAPKEEQTLKTLLQDLYQQTGCMPKSPWISKMIGNDTRSLSEQVSGLIAGGTSETHAKGSTRYDRILLASPRIRKALGCPVRPLQKHCELK